MPPSRKAWLQNSNKIDKLVREASVASQDQIRQFVSGMQTENLQLVKSYFKLSAMSKNNILKACWLTFQNIFNNNGMMIFNWFKPD